MAKNFKVTLNPEGDAPVETKNESIFKIISADSLFEACGCDPDACETERQKRLDEILAQTAELSAAINILAGVIQSLREEI